MEDGHIRPFVIGGERREREGEILRVGISDLRFRKEREKASVPLANKSGILTRKAPIAGVADVGWVGEPENVAARNLRRTLRPLDVGATVDSVSWPDESFCAGNRPR